MTTIHDLRLANTNANKMIGDISTELGGIIEQQAKQIADLKAQMELRSILQSIFNGDGTATMKRIEQALIESN